MLTAVSALKSPERPRPLPDSQAPDTAIQLTRGGSGITLPLNHWLHIRQAVCHIPKPTRTQKTCQKPAAPTSLYAACLLDASRPPTLPRPSRPDLPSMAAEGQAIVLADLPVRRRVRSGESARPDGPGFGVRSWPCSDLDFFRCYGGSLISLSRLQPVQKGTSQVRRAKTELFPMFTT